MMTKTPIYILDDDEQYSSLLHTVVKRKDYPVISNTSASSFLSANLPDSFVLILDLIMPEMDGIEVIRALASRDCNVSLLLISGFDDRVLHSAQQLAEAHKMEVLGCFTKPINIHEFGHFISAIDIRENASSLGHSSKQLTLGQLIEALEEKQLVLHYQPQIDLKTNTLLGYEALVRLSNPEEGLIYPDRFIQLAENNHLMQLLTQEVINIVCRDISAHANTFRGLVVSINISSQDIVSLEFPEMLEQITQQYGVSSNQLCLELTESAVMGELTSSLDVLNRLRMKGFFLSIDDFGTGFSSLTQLYNAPFSELKIDQHFVMRMETDSEAKVIVDICIMLGHKMGMKVVAEGVETYKIAKMLRAQNCDIAQGYGVSRPKQLKEILAWRVHYNESLVTES